MEADKFAVRVTGRDSALHTTKHFSANLSDNGDTRYSRQVDGSPPARSRNTNKNSQDSGTIRISGQTKPTLPHTAIDVNRTCLTAQDTSQ